MDDDLRPFCFVLAPFGRKADAAGNLIDFDVVYRDVLRPAIADAGLQPLRADEERDGGMIHKPMFERLLLCPYAVADLSLANANVFYELGVRHAVRPHSTLLLYSPSAQRLPFDVAPIRAHPYAFEDGGVRDAPALREYLRERLVAARDPAADSPLVQLLDGYEPPPLGRLKADVYRERVRREDEVRARLATARDGGAAALRAVAETMPAPADTEPGLLVDLLLSYRHASAWLDMVDLVRAMPPTLGSNVLVQEQLGLALNRLGRRSEAVRVLEDVVRRAGPSSETLGILGRVRKDAWQASAGDPTTAPALLDRAIATYRDAFEADWRDAYPGVNLVTLLALRDLRDPELAAILPVVRYANSRRLRAADYWDHATALELAVIGGDMDGARSALAEALAVDDVAGWMRETTARNLGLHVRSRTRLGMDCTELEAVADRLDPAWRSPAV